MKKIFNAKITKEDKWFVAQCIDVDVASQGKSEDEALLNLKEALELYFESPTPTINNEIRQVEVETSAA